MLIPVLVEAKLTELQTLSVSQRACGIERISISSAVVIPLETRALYPPIKLTPTSNAHLSSVLAILTKSSLVLQEAPPIRAIGVTEIRLFTIGIPNSFSIEAPTLTRSFAVVVIFLYIFSQVASISASIQSRRLIPRVMVRTSRFS